MNKHYARPTLLVQGKLEAMTQGAKSGNALDATYQQGTPTSELTFS
ncbi:putative RiPP precursor [Paracoccus sp. JM45]|nr:putative RiPP precursor [Paracoccus sp. JM45]RJE78704.1 putative RiPP precursor [Paracoccus sp. JM45]